MESYLLDWANLLLRWVHVITAIAWVGSSFYFVFLDSSLTPPVDEDLKKQGVSGELWAVHGGGFYHPVKFAVKPPELPQHLHWFYWESYSTWLSGFALFTASYIWNAGSYLVDKSLIASGTIAEVKHKTRGSYWTVGSPIKFSDTKPEVTASPLLGEHTDEVLAELGYSKDQIAAMHAAKAV